jgi:hypothetical protein
LLRAMPNVVARVDGRIHIALGKEGMYLDRRDRDDLVHVLAEAGED